MLNSMPSVQRINFAKMLPGIGICLAAFGFFPGTVFISASVAQDAPDLSFLTFEAAPLPLDNAGESASETSIAQEPASPLQAPALPLPENASDSELVSLESWLDTIRMPNPPLPTVDDDIARYQRAIREFEQTEGPFSPSLPQQLMDQAAAYRSKGEANQALELYERALHIIRVNNGLYSLEQKPVIESMVNTFLAKGDLLSANARQEYLFYLNRKSAYNQPTNVLLETLESYANWNLFTFRAFVSSNPVYNNKTSFNNEAQITQSYLELQAFRAESLLKAQTVFQKMIEIVKNEGGDNDIRLASLNRNLALSCFLYLSNFSINDDFQFTREQRPYDVSVTPLNTLCSRVGKDALETRLEILQENNASGQMIVDARLDMVDWLIFSKKRMEAQKVLQQTYEATVAENSLPAEIIESLFNPVLPEVIPRFGITSFSRATHNIPPDLNLEFKGYIDMEFSLTEYGATRSVTVLGKSAQTPYDVEAQLIRLLRRTMFRPRIKSGTIEDSELVQLRYYYTY